MVCKKLGTEPSMTCCGTRLLSHSDPTDDFSSDLGTRGASSARCDTKAWTCSLLVGIDTADGLPPANLSCSGACSPPVPDPPSPFDVHVPNTRIALCARGCTQLENLAPAAILSCLAWKAASIAAYATDVA